MVATVQIELMYGVSPGTFHARDSNAVASKSGTRYMTYDDGSDSSITGYPIPIPTNANGLSGSYWVTHCLNKTVAPDTYIKDIKYYQTWTTSPCADWSLSGSGWAGVKLKPGLYIGVSSQTAAACRNTSSGSQGFLSGNYSQATGVESVYGNVISGTSGHPYYSGGTTTAASGGMVSILNFNTLANAICVQSGNVYNNASSNSVGRTRCIVTQVLVGSGATAGNKADKTATWVYSEA